MARPVFLLAWNKFREVQLPVAEVGLKIGGKVGQNIAAGIFENACPIRISYVLNMTGFPVPKSPGWPTVSGADGKFYLFRVEDMMGYLGKVFGTPDKTVSSPAPENFSGLQGIIAVKGHGWRNAKGHVTLWDGSTCTDTCHLLADPDNGSFVPDTASLWSLP